MRHQWTCLLMLLSTFTICSTKPVFGPIGVAEKHKIAKMLEKEQKNLQMLEEEQALLERVVESLSKEIEDKEAHIEQLRSYTHGRAGLTNMMDDYYRTSFKSGNSGARPGR